jgi:hypothetical protein
MARVALSFLLMCAALLAFAGVSGATQSPGTGPKQDVVAGTATLVVPPPFLQAPQLHVNANNDPATGAARGHFFIRYSVPPIDIRGDAVCVDTLATTGTVIGQVESVTANPADIPPGFPGVNDFVRIRITDFGAPGTLDKANWDAIGSAQPATCPAQIGDLPISQGNYIVHDGFVPLELLPALDLLLSDIEAAAGD